MQDASAHVLCVLKEDQCNGSGSTMTWYVVVDDYCSDPHPDELVWTVSKDPKKTGWNTDSGYPGYALTRADAEELAYAANKLARSPK